MGKLVAQPPSDLSFAQTDAGEDPRFGESLRFLWFQALVGRWPSDRSGALELSGWINRIGGGTFASLGGALHEWTLSGLRLGRS